MRERGGAMCSTKHFEGNRQHAVGRSAATAACLAKRSYCRPHLVQNLCGLITVELNNVVMKNLRRLWIQVPSAVFYYILLTLVSFNKKFSTFKSITYLIYFNFLHPKCLSDNKDDNIHK